MLDILFAGTELEGKDIVELRKKAGLSLADVAASCDVSEMTVRNFESGKSPNWKVFKWYLAIFGTNAITGDMKLPSKEV